MGMNWDDGRLFLAVARSGTLLAAARRLGLNQATLSRRLSALERNLGIKLLLRGTRGCELTPEGEVLVPALERVESALLEAQSQLRDTTAEISGTVRIGAPDGLGVGFLAPNIARLAERHPGLTVQLVPVAQSFSLSQREADIAIMVGRPQQGRLVARKLTDYSLSLYASGQYLARHPAPESADQLAEHRLIGHVQDLIYTPALDFTREIWRGWRSDLEVATAIGQLTAVRGGAGIAILHDYLVRPEDDLVRLLPDLSLTRAYWVACHESLRNVIRVNVVMRFLVELAREARSGFVI